MKKIIYSLALVCLLLSSCCTAAKKEIGIQLYSVRELVGGADSYAQNHETVFKQLAEMGYTAVEAANYGDGKFYGVAPEQFKADLEAAGLKAISSHTFMTMNEESYANHDVSLSMGWWEECVAAHKAAGMKYIVAPWAPLPESVDEIKFECEYLNAIGKLCKENGIQFGYHNHSHEFDWRDDRPGYDWMLQFTDPEYVTFEMDVYWATNARVSPVEYFKNYPGRFKILHIKDWKEVGQSGMVGFDAIFNNFEYSGTEDIVVELEGSSYGDIMKSCGISADYLKNAPFVK